MQTRSSLLLTLFLVLMSFSAIAQLNSSLINANNSPFEQEVEFLPVEQAYQVASEFTDNNTLQLNWNIADGYYLYRHKFKFTLIENGNSQPLSPLLPEGIHREDEFFGPVETFYKQLTLTLNNIPSGDSTLIISSQGCADAGLCYPPQKHYLQLNGLNLTSLSSTAPQTTTNLDNANNNSLLYMLLLAAIGGIILNLMPCVFPILSLKVLSFANDSDHRQSLHGASYSAGVIISFVIIASLLISLQAAGQSIGWGFHLQAPWFVGVLAYLFFVIGLSLSGLINTSGQWVNIGGKLAAKSGYTGSFFTGVLATVVASPCTAPFMGTALGFAITQPPIIALSVFAALGIGMALPIFILSCSPALMKYMPKPGAWMEQFKQLLAFPLYATVIWLCWVIGNQTDINGMAAVITGCLLISLAIWLWNATLWKRLLSVILLALAISLLSSSLLTPSGTTNDNTTNNWQPYSPNALATLRQQQQAVFINITADWCLTCLANEKLTLNRPIIQQYLKDNNITYLKGDWTNYNAQITNLLKQHGRNGIPLYLVYPRNSQQPAKILPQLLTTELLLNALRGT